MSTLAQLQHVLDELASRARTERVPNWSAEIGIVIADSPWVTCSVGTEGIRILEGVGEVDTTLFARTSDAARRWLVDYVDYTHIVRDGDMSIEGSYFDVLLLSKALGLRPDRREISK